jgi:hypothetical protein
LVTNELVWEFNVYGDNIDSVWLLSKKLLVCELVTNDVVASFGTYPNTLPLNDPVIPCVTNNEPVITADPEYGNPAPAPAFNAYEEVSANDAVDAYDADIDVVESPLGPCGPNANI